MISKDLNIRLVKAPAYHWKQEEICVYFTQRISIAKQGGNSSTLPVSILIEEFVLQGETSENVNLAELSDCD